MKATFRIAGGLTCEFRYRPDETVQVEARWDPARPDILTGQALRRYRAARAQFLDRVQREMGAPLLAIDAFGLTDDQVRDVAFAMAPAAGTA